MERSGRDRAAAARPAAASAIGASSRHAVSAPGQPNRIHPGMEPSAIVPAANAPRPIAFVAGRVASNPKVSSATASAAAIADQASGVGAISTPSRTTGAAGMSATSPPSWGRAGSVSQARSPGTRSTCEGGSPSTEMPSGAPGGVAARGGTARRTRPSRRRPGRSSTSGSRRRAPPGVPRAKRRQRTESGAMWTGPEVTNRTDPAARSPTASARSARRKATKAASLVARRAEMARH
ncbi:MAG: hypothetical protein DMF78_06255 [Acidobacteria bacterium]|nr:MAG: hypothetical protein DMF78_06255 [Acidobacteriota bacterium]